MPTGLQTQLWRRLAVSFAVVGALLLVGTSLPIFGIEPIVLDQMAQACGGGLTSLYGLLLPACPQRLILHNQLGQSTFLGAVAMFAFAFLSMRRWLTN